MDNDNPKREGRIKARLILIGMLLGILGQSIYDILRTWYQLTYPVLPFGWIDALAATLAVTAIWGSYRINEEWNQWWKGRKGSKEDWVTGKSI